MTTRQKYCISIYPNGINKASVELLFNSQEEQMEYVREESKYCRKEHASYLSELGNQEERLNKKEQFYKCRVNFAKKKEFSPINASQWQQKAKKPNPGSTPLGVA